MSEFVSNSLQRRSVRKFCVFYLADGQAPFAIFQEHRSILLSDIEKNYLEDYPIFDEFDSKYRVIQAIRRGINSNYSIDIHDKLISVSSITRNFQPDPEANQPAESTFSVSLAAPAPLILSDHIDNARVDVFEYDKTVFDLQITASGIIVPGSITFTDQSLSFSCSDRLAQYYKNDVLEYKIRYSDFPQAPYTSFGRFVPVVYGSVQNYLLLTLDEGPTADLNADLQAETVEAERQADLGEGSVDRFIDLGSEHDEPFKVIIEDEVAGVLDRDTGEAGRYFQLLRVSGSPEHKSGAQVRHFSPILRWAISAYGIQAIERIRAYDKDNKALKPNQNEAVELVSVQNPSLDLSTLVFEKDILVLKLPFRGPVDASGVNFSSTSVIEFDSVAIPDEPSGNYNRKKQYFTTPLGVEDLTNIDNLIGGDPMTLWLVYGRPGPLGEILRFSTSGIGTLPPITAASLTSIQCSIIQTAANPTFGNHVWAPDIDIVFSIGASKYTIHRLLYNTFNMTVLDELNQLSAITDLSDIDDITISISNKAFIPIKQGATVEVNENAIEIAPDSPVDTVALVLAYDSTFITDISNITDADDTNYAEIVSLGTLTAPITRTFGILFGAHDIGTRNVINVRVTMRCYMNILLSSHVKVKLISRYGESSFVQFNVANTVIGSGPVLGVYTPAETSVNVSSFTGSAYDPVHFTKEFLKEDSTFKAVIEVKNTDPSDILQIFGLRIDLDYDNAGYTFPLFSADVIADVEGMQDKEDHTGFADGLITGTADTLIQNPADAIRAIAIIHHEIDAAQIGKSFDYAREYYSRLTGAASLIVIASVFTGGCVLSGTDYIKDQWVGYVLKDDNNDTFYITANTETNLYFHESTTPKLGKGWISGLWKFGGALSGEIGSANLFGDLQRQFCCKIGYDIVSRDSALKILYPLLGIEIVPTIRLFGEGGSAHETMPSFLLPSGDLQFHRMDEPVSKVTVNYRKVYRRNSDQSSEWENSVNVASNAVQRGREINIDASYINDHFTARLLAQAVIELYGQKIKQCTIPVPPDAFLVLRWGSIVEIVSKRFLLTPIGDPMSKVCQVIGMDYTPGQPGTITVIDKAIYGTGPIPIRFPAPVLTDVEFSSGTNAGGKTVTLTGSGFLGISSATFGGVLATGVTILSSTQLTCVTPAHANGPVDVTISNPDGQSSTLEDGYTYYTVGAPPTSGLKLDVYSDALTFQDVLFATPAVAGDTVQGWKSNVAACHCHSTSGTPPLLVASKFGAKPGILVSPSRPNLHSSLSPDLSFALTSATVFIVGRFSSDGALYTHYYGSFSGSWEGHQLMSSDGLGDAPYVAPSSLFVGNMASTASAKLAGSSWALGDVPMVIRHAWNGTHAGHKLWINGSLQTLTDGTQTGTNGTINLAEFYIGSSHGIRKIVTGHFGAVLAYSPALSEADALQVDRYLGDRFGIDIP